MYTALERKTELKTKKGKSRTLISEGFSWNMRKIFFEIFQIIVNFLLFNLLDPFEMKLLSSIRNRITYNDIIYADLKY